MLKMLRKNLLVDTGDLVSPIASNVIVYPDEYKKVNVRGTIKSVGPACRMFGAGDVGKEVVVQSFHSSDHNLSPTASEAVGLAKHWHFIAHEDRVQIAIE